MIGSDLLTTKGQIVLSSTRNARTQSGRALIGSIALALTLAACGQPGSSGTEANSTAGSGGAGCAPIAGDSLVVLKDDKSLQNTDNVIPAINSDVATPALVEALDGVSAALTTDDLIALNHAVDIERKTSPVVAKDFATEHQLTADIAGSESGSVIVGAANFAESETIAELYKIVLTAVGYDVTVQQIGNRELYEPALEKGDIQVVPEYAATMADFLNAKLNGADADPVSSPDLATTVSHLTSLGEQVGLVFGTAAQAQDQNSFAVTTAFSETYGVTTLSELAATCSGTATILGGPPECPQRHQCQAGLVDVYAFQAGSFSSLDAGGPQTKTALTTGVISVGLVFSSDGALGS